MANVSDREAGSQQCCICLESFEADDASMKLVSMECCKPSRAHRSPLCEACCIVLTRHGQFDGVGRCPLCRSFFRLLDPHAKPVTVEILTNVSQCRCCNQLRTIVANDAQLCDACVIGQQVCLRYECQQCRGAQRIPHPMWRYQPTPTSFTTDTWACQRCGTFTHWRVYAADVERVPHDDAPEGWGRREQWLDQVRAQRYGAAAGQLGGSGPLQLVVEFLRLLFSVPGLVGLLILAMWLKGDSQPS